MHGLEWTIITESAPEQCEIGKLGDFGTNDLTGLISGEEIRESQVACNIFFKTKTEETCQNI